MATLSRVAPVALGLVPEPKPAAESLLQSPVPYAIDALAPLISAITLRIHYGKHHKAYIDKLNELILGTPYAAQSLEQIFLATAGVPDMAAIFDNAAQTWNHDFYWQSLRPQGGGNPPPALKSLIGTSFGNVEALKSELHTAATTLFGSGWTWLVLDGAKLTVVKMGNANNPVTAHKTPCWRSMFGSMPTIWTYIPHIGNTITRN